MSCMHPKRGRRELRRRNSLRPLFVLLLAACTQDAVPPASSPASVQQAAPEQPTSVGVEDPDKRDPDVIYLPTPMEVVDAMLILGRVQEGDVLYDLGSGDGRIPIAAAKRYQVRGTGIEIREDLIAEANANARKEGVQELVTFKQADLFTTDFSDATVVTLYLLEALNMKLRPRLLNELKPGTRIVSHNFSMGEWSPAKTQQVGSSVIYLWIVPEQPSDVIP